MVKVPPLSLHDKTTMMQTVTWVKTVNDARPAGAPPSYPSQADIDSSALFKRIRLGLPPMPWAPPTRHRHPAYELIENARGRHRVTPDAAAFDAQTVSLDGAQWHRLASDDAARVHHVSFGRWPLAYRLVAEDAPRWSNLPDDVDEGPGHDVVRFADGRLVPKDMIRRTRNDIETRWSLQCVSPLDERLYLRGERLPLDDPDHFRPARVHRATAQAPQVFDCALRQGTTLFFPLARDDWTRVTRYVGFNAEPGHDIAQWLSRFDAGESPLDLVSGATQWQVFEIDANGQPWSAWRTHRREWLAPVANPQPIEALA
jgi:hypothetical protein